MENSDKEKVFIIGGAGYLGTPLVHKLDTNRCRITLLDSFLFDQPTNLYNDALVIKDDVNNIKNYEKEFLDSDYILYMNSPRLPQIDSKEDISNELEYLKKTLSLLDRQKFIFLSSCSVYGTSSQICTEESPTQITSNYSELKIESEKMIEKYYKNHLILRLSTLFGKSTIERNDLLINNLIKEVKEKGVVKIYDDNAWRPNLHVNDCANIIIDLIFNDLKYSKINVGFNSFNITKKQIIEEIKKSSSQSFKTEYVVTKDPRSYKVNFDKLESITSLRPKTYEEYFKEDFFA